jgi:LemA protein
MENNTNTNNNINLGEELQNRAKNQVLKAVDTNWSSFFTGRNVLIILAVLFALYILSGYNKLARAANEIDAQWAQVNTVLQRRFDAIEQSVGGLKISNKSEQDALQKITDARKIYTAAQGDTEGQVAAVNNYAGALNGLLLSRAAIGEQYPNLKTPELVGGLIQGVNVEGNENRIAVERQRYNEIVKSYNDMILTFPSSLTAKVFGFAKRSYFDLVNTEANQAPKIGEDLKF